MLLTSGNKVIYWGVLKRECIKKSQKNTDNKVVGISNLNVAQITLHAYLAEHRHAALRSTDLYRQGPLQGSYLQTYQISFYAVLG